MSTRNWSQSLLAPERGRALIFRQRSIEYDFWCDGALSLTNAAMAQNHFRKQKEATCEAKRTLVANLEGKSTREAEREIAAQNPEPRLRPDSAKPFGAETTELRMASAQSRSEIRNFHRQMLKKAGDELNRTDAAAFERRLITGITTTANVESIAIAKKMLSDAIHEIATFLSSADGDEVYQIAVQLFPLTKQS
jgi:Domain of unknown function (DUF4423)